ncbi:MAG TPA: CoA transferase, partial [Ilumatobacteraceae bacterium]|nr:CoA transferase [Ilumatobacteraceae bacterium]
HRALDAVGHPEIADAIMAVPDGVDLTRRMFTELASIVRTGPSAKWLAALEAADVPAAPCLTIDQHLADAQTAHNDLYQVNEWPDWPEAGPMRQVRYPAVFSTWGKLHSTGGPPALRSP